MYKRTVFIFFLGFLLSAAPAIACEYAQEKNPLDAYIEATVIFTGKVDDTGIEILDKRSLNFTLFRVDELIKGRYERRIKIYHDKDFKGLPKGSSGLVVALPGEGDRPFISDCTAPYYDFSVQPGKSVYDLYKSILRKLHLIMILTAVFASFLFFLFIKARALPRSPQAGEAT